MNIINICECEVTIITRDDVTIIIPKQTSKEMMVTADMTSFNEVSSQTKKFHPKPI